MNAAEINGKLRQAKQERIKTYPCNNLRASNIGHPCERYLFLLIRNWEEQEPHGVGLQHIFDLGTYLEDYAIQQLKDAGYEVITPTNRSWKIESPLITGREDIRLKDPKDGQLYPCEIKWISPYEWEKLNCVDDFYRSKRHYVRGYPAQLMIYEYKFGKETGYFALGNKLTGEVKVIECPFDWDRADAFLKKGERIYHALDSNDIESLGRTTDFHTCDQCALAHVCGASIVRPETDIDAEGELAALVDERNDLAAAANRHKEINEEIKDLMTGRKKVISGDYVLERRTIKRGAYTAPESEYDRIFVMKLQDMARRRTG